jgi:chromosome segregation ATPase
VLTETKLSETTSSLAAAHGHIAELNHTVAENAATIESTSAAQRELEERVRVMKAEFERIGDGREVLEYENNRLERQLRELTEARERELEAGDELKKVKAELRRHEEESEKVKAELERLEQKTEERREESADAEQNLVEELDLARNETELAEAELARVKSELESSSARLAARESEGDAWKAERAVSMMSCFAIMLMNVVYIRRTGKAS